MHLREIGYEVVD